MNTQLNLPFDANALVRCIEDALNSNNSMSTIEGSEVIFATDDNLIPLNGWSNEHKANVEPIYACYESKYVIAIDSSSIFLADTPDGSIYASKCGIAVAREKRQAMHFKIGPSLLYIDNSNRFALLDKSMIKRLIRVRVERALQYKLAQSLKDSIILLDGSLKVSLFEDSRNSLNNIVDECFKNNNILLGISKVSRIKMVERLIRLLMSNTQCYLDISSLLRAYISNLIGKQLLARLSNDGLVLRIDSIYNPKVALSLLIANDMLYNGYPETLRLAHHLSVFTKTELLATISIVRSRFNLNEVYALNARKALLGVVGGKAYEDNRKGRQ